MFKIVILLTVIVISLNAELKEIANKVQKQQQTFVNKMSKKMIDKYDSNTIAEYNTYKKNIEKKKEEKKYILYFTSQSLKGSDLIALIKEASRYSMGGEQIRVSPIMRGFDDGVIEYAHRLYDEIETLPPLQKKQLKKTAETLKFKPKLFKLFNITEVPTIVTARCTVKVDQKHCKFYYKSTGKTSIMKLLELTNISISELFQEVKND